MFATVVVESPYLHMHTLGGPDQPNARPRIYSQFNTFHHIYTFPHIQSLCRKKNELKVFEKVGQLSMILKSNRLKFRVDQLEPAAEFNLLK